jgi:hypothetical protein
MEKSLHCGLTMASVDRRLSPRISLPEVAEMALADSVSDETVARTIAAISSASGAGLMQSWAEFLTETKRGRARFSRFAADDI